MVSRLIFINQDKKPRIKSETKRKSRGLIIDGSNESLSRKRKIFSRNLDCSYYRFVHPV